MPTKDFIKYISNYSNLNKTYNQLTKIIVVIPCYNETTLFTTLNSLNNCNSKHLIEVVVCINFGENVEEDIKQSNINTFNQLNKYLKNEKYQYRIHPLLASNLPHKTAGVGLARKIGMDYACSIFDSINYDGVLVCLDADCQVETNYIDAIHAFFDANEYEAASIHFEHPFPNNTNEKSFIVDYELHLRYHINFQKWLKLPFAFQTIGSSMAVKKSAYIKEGGMNKRKAGEDFYFIHKFTSKNTLGEIKSTTVLPSARVSDRVPFGTGKAIQDRLDGDEPGTYNPQSYLALVALINKIAFFYTSDLKLQDLKLDDCLAQYLTAHNFNNVITEIKRNTTSKLNFEKRFWQWFNAFRLMKFLHYSRDKYYPNIAVEEAGNYLYNLLENTTANLSAEELLLWFRKHDKT